MICNYQNITDYCSNRYSYQFIGTISNNGVVSIDKSETAPVLRTDKITGQNKVITQFSTDLIQPCSSTEDNEGTTEWDCYIIYRYISNGYISDPSLDTLKNDQIDIINNAYQSSIEEGVLVQINNVDVILGSSIEDQIYYQSILNYAQVLYDDDSDAVMPSFTDAQNNVYKVSYDTLITIFKTYFTKVIYYKNLKESLVFQVSDSNTISDLESLDWCNTKVLINNLQSTKIQTTINKLVVQSCEDNTNNGGSLCDPPCDPNSCLVCVDGSCESSCGQDQYCEDGLCKDNVVCTQNDDCADRYLFYGTTSFYVFNGGVGSCSVYIGDENSDLYVAMFDSDNSTVDANGAEETYGGRVGFYTGGWYPSLSPPDLGVSCGQYSTGATLFYVNGFGCSPEEARQNVIDRVADKLNLLEAACPNNCHTTPNIDSTVGYQYFHVISRCCANDLCQNCCADGTVSSDNNQALIDFFCSDPSLAYGFDENYNVIQIAENGRAQPGLSTWPYNCNQ